MARIFWCFEVFLEPRHKVCLCVKCNALQKFQVISTHFECRRWVSRHKKCCLKRNKLRKLLVCLIFHSLNRVRRRKKKEQCKKNEKSLQSTPANADSAEIEYTWLSYSCVIDRNSSKNIANRLYLQHWNHNCDANKFQIIWNNNRHCWRFLREKPEE